MSTPIRAADAPTALAKAGAEVASAPAHLAPEHRVASLEALEALYGAPREASILKVTARLTPSYRRFVEASPFLIIASRGPQGLDCSPRGDPAGFVRIADDRTLLIPDRRGNNRIDTLRNLIADPAVGLIFFVPGAGETLRVRGCASITTHPPLLESFAVDGKRPATVLAVEIEQVFFQCARAIVRSRLWRSVERMDGAAAAGAQAEGASAVPTAGTFLADAAGPGFDAEAYDRDLATRLPSSLY